MKNRVAYNNVFFFFIGVFSTKLRDADECDVARGSVHFSATSPLRSIYGDRVDIRKGIRDIRSSLSTRYRRAHVDPYRPQFHDSHGFSFHLQGLRNRSYRQRYGREREWNRDFRMPRHEALRTVSFLKPYNARASRENVWNQCNTARSADNLWNIIGSFVKRIPLSV